MKVRKRDSRLQDFNLDKIKRTIANASDDINEGMTEGDLKSISDEIEEKVMKEYDEEVSSLTLRKIIEDMLISFGFSRVAESYKNSDK
ncbi:ATP cone domain-containing protein [Clostridium polynesiense]|uniref:ATP cone domain-containing protein n=1 Tax=Clostridium polynesiense TaxID=1325933 RepID=UPI00058CCC6B|nr:ATP cone domain-containing protein [Clostridium polynesiense]